MQDLPGPRRRGRRRQADFETLSAVLVRGLLPANSSVSSGRLRSLMHNELTPSLPDDATALYFRRGSMLACAIAPSAILASPLRRPGRLYTTSQNPLFIPEAIASPKSEDVFRAGSFSSAPSSVRCPDSII
ncbi:hypothetical protein K438DRAFT_1969627 [Mycena galopus ATCC 62051]|nr:hypothetical protein K438DRAFT_1969627 [Mycena galopus ATCC 62051]